MTGVLSNNAYTGIRFPTDPYLTSGGRTNIPLNTAYVHGTSGAGFAVRYQARTADPINEMYIMIDAGIGTPALITCSCVLYNEHATTATQPGSTARATGTVTMPSTVPKWAKVVFSSPYTPAVGEVVWFVIASSAAAPATNYPSILCSFNASPAFPTMVGNHNAYSTVNGFSTAGTVQGRASYVVVQGTKSYGWSTTILNSAVLASGTTMKGFQITPRVNIEVIGWQTAVPNGQMTGIRIYDAATPPAGSALYTYALGTDANQSRDELIGAKFFAPIILSGGTTYNVVTAWASAAPVGGVSIEDYATYPAIFDDLVDGFVNCFPVSDVGGVWTLTRNGFVNQQLIISDFPPPAAVTMRRPKVWNGVSWQEKPMGVWNGTTWEEQPFKVWNGSVWV